MPFENLLQQDAQLLRKFLDVEEQFVKHGARVLSDEIKARFTKSKLLINKHARGFAEIYAYAMELAWLYGNYHVNKLLDIGGAIELSMDEYDVPFQHAADFIRSQITIDSSEYSRLEANLKYRAFTIARVGQEDIINKIKQKYIDHIENGTPRLELLQNIDTLLDEAGVSEANQAGLELHYRNNMMNAYNAGRWAQLEHNELVEILMYNAIVDDDTTDLCRELHATVKPKRDKFWKKFHPGNHHKCRSILTPISRSMMGSRDLTPSSTKASDIYKLGNAAREHQFRAHPGDAIKTIPASLASRSVKYGLGPEILQYTATSNRSFFKKRITEIKKSTIGKAAIKHAVSRRPALAQLTDDVQQAIKESHEAWLAFSPRLDGSFDASIVAINWTNQELQQGIAVGFRAFEGGAHTFYTMTKFKMDELKAHGARKIYSK